MKKMIILSLVAAGVLFVGCGEEGKIVKEETVETTSTSDEAKEVTRKAAESTQKLAEEKAAEAKKATEEIVETAKEAAVHNATAPDKR